MRVLVVALAVQLVLAGLLIWGAATGFSYLRGWLIPSQAVKRPPPAQRAPPMMR